MVTARARVLSRPGVDVLRQWVAEPQGTGFAALPPARQGGRAGMPAALGSSQLRDAAGARRWAGQLQQLVKNDAAATRLAKLLRAELELAADDAPLRWRPCHRGFTPARMLLRTQNFAAHRPVERGDGAAADLAGDPPARCFGVAGHGSCLECAGPATACSTGRGGSACGALRLRCGGGPLQGRAGSGAAQHIGRYHFEASIIDTRLRAVQSLLREQAAER